MFLRFFTFSAVSTQSCRYANRSSIDAKEIFLPCFSLSDMTTRDSEDRRASPKNCPHCSDSTLLPTFTYFFRGETPPLPGMPDLQLQNHLWSTYILGHASPWIDCDSKEEWLAALSEVCLEQEISYAAYLGVRSFSIELKNRDSPRLAKIISKWLWTKNTELGFWIFVPTDGIGEPTSKDSRDTWGIWADFRTLCGNFSIDRLQCGIRVTPNLAPEFENCSHSLRWKGEPVAAFWYDTEVFMTEPTTSQACLSIIHSRLLSELWFSSKQKVIVSSKFPVADERRPQYSKILRVVIASKMRVLEMHAQLTSTYVGVSDYVDSLQPPLQPLSHDLSSGIYDTLEQDPVKYVKYQEALELAIEELYERCEDIVIYILGAGRGPLVNTALASAAKFSEPDGTSKIQIVAVEKNPNACQTLYFCNMKKWGQYVNLIGEDMRDLEKFVKSGELFKPDIIVSELLGSFGDNELAPECIDGLTPILQPHTICIPQRYRNFAVPIQSLRLHQGVIATEPRGYHKVQNFRGRGKPTHQSDGTFKVEGFDFATACFDQVYVACMRSYTPLAALKKIFAFEHPNIQGKSNDREVTVSYTMDRDCEVMGFAGFFDVVLYKNVFLSITPTEQTEGLISWFPALIPLRKLQRLRDGDKIDFHISRKSDDEGVWYEWHISTFDAKTNKMVDSEVQNKDGASYYMRLK
uniref:Protein arginine N-methyltransferase n=1 Tax=Steinernema glaseri TaxID=37863 RepID=A0A1I8AVN4_9BILA